MGVLQASATGLHRLSAPLLHLRTLNPYVTSTMEQSAGTTCWSLPRQHAPVPLLSSGVAIKQQRSGSNGSGSREGACGVSAFAFQGTNAHVLLMPPTDAHMVANSKQGAAEDQRWQSEHFWLVPTANVLVHVFAGTASGTTAVFEALLSSPHVAYLFEHQVSLSA